MERLEGKDKYGPVVGRPRRRRGRMVSSPDFGEGEGGRGATDSDVGGPTPTQFEIIEETIHFAPDGTYTVDVTIQWNTILGASAYEVRYNPL
jgi:hypothetical protein